MRSFYSTLVRLKGGDSLADEQTVLFLFHIGTIKSFTIISTHTKINEVSIPHWYD